MAQQRSDFVNPLHVFVQGRGTSKSVLILFSISTFSIIVFFCFWMLKGVIDPEKEVNGVKTGRFVFALDDGGTFEMPR